MQNEKLYYLFESLRHPMIECGIGIGGIEFIKAEALLKTPTATSQGVAEVLKKMGFMGKSTTQEMGNHVLTNFWSHKSCGISRIITCSPCC